MIKLGDPHGQSHSLQPDATATVRLIGSLKVTRHIKQTGKQVHVSRQHYTRLRASHPANTLTVRACLKSEDIARSIGVLPFYTTHIAVIIYWSIAVSIHALDSPCPYSLHRLLLQSTATPWLVLESSPSYTLPHEELSHQPISNIITNTRLDAEHIHTNHKKH
jgi:hypothetical protein